MFKLGGKDAKGKRGERRSAELESSSLRISEGGYEGPGGQAPDKDSAKDYMNPLAKASPLCNQLYGPELQARKINAWINGGYWLSVTLKEVKGLA